MKKYIVVPISVHSDKFQKGFKSGQVVEEDDFHAGEAERLKAKGYLRDYTAADAEKDALNRLGIPVPEVVLPPLHGVGSTVENENANVLPLDISLSLVKLEKEIASCTDKTVLQQTLEAEQAASGRKKAIELLESRIKELAGE